MKSLLRLASVLIALLVLPLAGCFQQDRLNSPTIPDRAAVSGTPASEVVVVPIAPPADPAATHPSVSKVFGPEGGTIAMGRIMVQFPPKSLPRGQTTITLTAWGDDDAYYFTVEPRALKLARPVALACLIGDPTLDLSFYWNDNGWRAPLSSDLSSDGTLLLAQAGFLGEFVVAPTELIDGRAGW